MPPPGAVNVSCPAEKLFGRVSLVQGEAGNSVSSFARQTSTLKSSPWGSAESTITLVSK